MAVEANKAAKNPLLDAISEIQMANPELQKEEKDEGLVDIITFCNDPQYLNMPESNFVLWTPQIIILKCFYMGTKGNENLRLTPEEWQWLEDNRGNEERDGMVFEKNIDDVIAKIEKKERATGDDSFDFEQLHLVLGRRGTKTILASVISAYEAYKVLTVGDGDPHKYYGLPDDDEIAIINVALSEKQAGRLFIQVQARLRNSPFFQKHIANETTREIRLLTKKDLKKQQEKKSKLKVPGSVVFLCGHSNPDTLRGYSTVLLLFDELAFYDDTGKVTGQYFYNTLKPSLAKFKKFGEGRIVAISSPWGMSGIFYDLFLQSKKSDKTLSFQLPTWCVNEDISYEDLEEDRTRNPEAFAIEYGAQWATSGTLGNFFPEGLVDRCVMAGMGEGLHAITRPDTSLPMNYYLHIDPAKHGDKYVAVMVGRQYYKTSRGQRRIKIRLINVWTWEPTPGIGLDYHQIDKSVINICNIFRPMAVSYDQYNSEQSQQLLKSCGINVVELSYNRAVKMKIYQNLLDLMAYQPEPELLLYDEPKLVLEMKALKKRPTQRGFGLVKGQDGDVQTDDVIDCLAGASAMASGSTKAPLPAPVTVRMGFT